MTFEAQTPSALLSPVSSGTRLARWALLLCLFAAAPSLGCKSSEGTKIDEETQLELYRELALRWYQMDELDRAEVQVQKALALEPKDEQLTLMLGWIRQRRGRPEDVLMAEKVFRSLDHKKDYRAALGLASSLERKGLAYSEKAQDIEEGRRSSSNSVKEAKQTFKKADGIWEESIKRYKQTLKLNPKNARAMSGLQRVCSLRGNFNGSLAWSQEHANVLTEELAFRRRQLTVPELTNGEELALRDSIAGSEEALIANYMHAAPLYMTVENYKGAKQSLESVLELDPELSTAYALRAQVLAELGETDAAIQSVDRFLALSTNLDFEHPDIRRAYDLRSELRRKQ